MSEQLLVTFVSSAYNEQDNLKELVQRCQDSLIQAEEHLGDSVRLQFRMIIADNASTDDSKKILREICESDNRVTALLNRRNYGPETSAANALRYSIYEGLIILLCSDLQDPPEYAAEMIKIMHCQSIIDGVFACKAGTNEPFMLKKARQAYYSFLSYSSRLSQVSSGYHGFGCYRAETIEVALDIWDSSNLNLRQCLEAASEEPEYIVYRQEERRKGVSTYTLWGYIKEAGQALAAGDATTSRASMFFGIGGLSTSLPIALFIILNTISGRSNYEPGTPTIMVLLLICFATQMITISLLSRQIENMRNEGLRKRVRYSKFGHS